MITCGRHESTLGTNSECPYSIGLAFIIIWWRSFPDVCFGHSSNNTCIKKKKKICQFIERNMSTSLKTLRKIFISQSMTQATFELDKISTKENQSKKLRVFPAVRSWASAWYTCRRSYWFIVSVTDEYCLCHWQWLCSKIMSFPRAHHFKKVKSALRLNWAGAFILVLQN